MSCDGLKYRLFVRIVLTGGPHAAKVTQKTFAERARSVLSCQGLECSSPEPYDKIEGAVELRLELTGGLHLLSEAIALIGSLGTGDWQLHEEADEMWAVWSRVDDALDGLDHVTWMNIEVFPDQCRQT